MGTHLLFKPLRMKIIIFAAILSVALCLPKDPTGKDVEMSREANPAEGNACGCIGAGCNSQCGPATKPPPKCGDKCETDRDCQHEKCSSCNDLGYQKQCGFPRKVTNNQCGNICKTDDECYGSHENKCAKCCNVGYVGICGFDCC